MRKGYLFIRGRTRFAPFKLGLLSLTVVVVGAAAVPRGDTANSWRPLDAQSTARTAAAAHATANMTCADFDNQAEAQAYVASSQGPGDPHRDRNAVPCERLP